MSPVVSESVFVEICLQIVRRNRMIDATNPVLNQTPQALDGVGVNVALHVDARGMLDSAVPIVQRNSIFAAQVADAIVGTKLIGINGAAWSDVFLNESGKNVAVH